MKTILKSDNTVHNVVNIDNAVKVLTIENESSDSVNIDNVFSDNEQCDTFFAKYVCQ